MGVVHNAANRWKELPAVNRSILVVLLACIMLSAFSFYRWWHRVEYAPLFTNMQAGSAGKVVEKLKALEIPYRLTDGGSTILVPQDQVYDLRLNMASEGIFSEGGVGFELFDKRDLGVTDFERRLNYQRALQEELRRTIVQLEAVEQARVHLMLPEKSVFLENEGTASASIVLKLSPLKKLSPDQVKGIAELVAHSVEGLSPDNVTIIDVNGNLLDNYLLSDSSGTVGNPDITLTQLELKREFEKSIERNICEMLEKIYGPGKVVAMVTAQLDFNQKEVSRIIWGDQGVVASEQIIQRKDSTSTNPLMPVGAENRELMTAYENSLQDPDVVSMDVESIRNYEINKTEEREIFAPGRLISLSTAIAVDGALTEEKEMQISEMVSAAIGVDYARGDQINVMGMEFDRTTVNEMKAEMAKFEAEQKEKEKMEDLIFWGLRGLALILAFILGIIFIRSITSVLRSRAKIPQPIVVGPIEEEVVSKTVPKSDALIKEQKVQEIVEAQPEVAAQVISSWLQEYRSEPNG